MGFRKAISGLALALLLVALGVYLGGKAQFKNQIGAPLHPTDVLMLSIITLPQYVKNFTKAPSWVLNPERGQLPPSMPTDAHIIGQKKIPAANAFMLTSVFDHNKNQFLIKKIHLSSAQCTQTWRLNYPTAQQATQQWLNQNRHKFFNIKNYGITPYLKPLPLQCVRVLANGDVVGRFLGQPDEFCGMVCFDTTGQIKWLSNAIAHHSIELGLPNQIYLATWAPNSTRPYDTDAIGIINYRGQTVYLKTIRQIAEKNPQLNLTEPSPFFYKDLYHLNDVEPVTTHSSKGYWQPGDVFISLRNTNTVLLYRPATDSVLWHQSHPWIRQHDVSIVNDSTISIFSNNHYFYTRNGGFDSTAVAECYFYHFASGTTTKPFSHLYQKYKAKTPTQGRAVYFENQRLFITELSDAGYYLISTPDTNYKAAIAQPNHANLTAFGAWAQIIPAPH